MERINVTRPFLAEREEYDALLSGIWNRHWITNNGVLHEELDQALKAYLGIDNLLLFTNGHLALETALTGLDLTGGEIITTPFTFISTTNAIVRSGAKPVFCDINEDNLTIDETKIESLITDKTKAIVPVHVYGHPCHVEEIQRIADKHHIKVVYDAAHAFGVRYNQESICAWGDVSMLSFHATKLFHTIEGGALLTKKDSGAFRKMGLLRNYGIISEEEAEYIGGNAKMNEFQAAMGLVNLKHMNQLVAERKSITLAYRERLSEIPGIKFYVPESNGSVTYNYAYLPVLINECEYGLNRDQLYEKLKSHNIYARKYFYPLTYDFACYSDLKKSADTPVAKKISDRILCLPIYNGLTFEQVSMICDCLRY